MKSQELLTTEIQREAEYSITASHPEYVKKNREAQSVRDRRKKLRLDIQAQLSKYSVNPCYRRCQGAQSISLKSNERGNRRISLFGRGAELCTSSFPRPLVCPTYIQFAAL